MIKIDRDQGFFFKQTSDNKSHNSSRHQVGGFVFYHQPTATYFCKVFLTLAAFLPLFLKQNNLLFFDK